MWDLLKSFLTQISFVLDLNGRHDTVSIDHLKAAHIDQTSVTFPSVLLSLIQIRPQTLVLQAPILDVTSISPVT